MIPKILSFLDVETTGTSPNRDRIIDIGIVRVENGEITNTFDTLIDPGEYIPPEITRITGITTKLLERAPTFSDKADEISELLSGSVVVAHNAGFDTSFLRTEYMRIGGKFTNRHLCTVKLSRTLFPRFRRHNLDSIIERFGFKCEPRHRALPDAKVLWDFFKLIQDQINIEKLEYAIKTQLKRPTIPKGISVNMVDNLPESPGVYIFYGAGGSTLYIGKSINIKDRVKSHFYETKRETKEFHLAEQLTHIETIVTEGELEALLTERKMIASEKPLFNRKLRNIENMCVALAGKVGEYMTISLVESSNITPDDLPNIMAVYKTKGKAKKDLLLLSKKYKLCNILLGLEKGTKCFGSQIEQCNGACSNSEIPVFYNVRFTEAFSNSKVKVWPFNGPILISEGGKAHMIDKWCYIGVVEGEDSKIIRSPDTTMQFDWDTYKILSNYLLKPQTMPKIKVIH